MGKEKNSSLWIKLESKISQYPVVIITVILLITGIFGYFMIGTKIDNDIMSMIPSDNPTKVFSDKIKHVLGDSNGIVIALENEKGFVNQETLGKIKVLTEKIENMDNTINQDLLKQYLNGFSAEEQAAFLGMLNEILPEMKDAKDLQKALNNLDTISEYFTEEASQQKLQTLAKTESKVAGIFWIFKHPTDELKKWTKRVRKVNSAATVDYVFSEYAQAEKLQQFFAGKKITSPSAMAFANYLLEKSLITSSAGRDFLKTTEMQRIALLFGMSQEEVARVQNFNNAEQEQFFNLLQKSPKQIKVNNLLNSDKVKSNPALELFLFAERMKSWNFYEKTLYSPVNDKVSMVSVEMVPQIVVAEKELLIKYVNETVAETFKGTGIKYHISGDPVITALMGQYMLRDLKFLFPIVVLVMAFFLYAAFRHWRGIALPMVTVVITVVWTLGTVALLGYSITFVATILPVLMVAVGSAYGIHIIHHYYEDRALGMDKLDALKKTVHEIGGAVIMAGLTTIVGFGSLAANKVIPLKEFGIFTAVGIAYALIVSLIFIPALLRTGKLPKKIAALHVDKEEYFEEAHGPLGRVLEKIGHWTVHKHKYFFGILAVVLGVSIAGTTLMKVEVNPIDMFKQSTPIQAADKFIRDNFAGTSTFDLILDTGEQNGIVNPDFLHKVDKLQSQLENDAVIGKIMSPVDFIKKMHQSMHYGEAAFYKIPEKVFDAQGQEVSFDKSADKKQALSSIVLGYISMFDRDDLRMVIDQNKQLIKMGIILKTGSTIATSKLTERIKEMVKKTFTSDVKVTYAGINPLYNEVNMLLVKGLVASTLISALLVMFLVMFIERSILIGLVSVVPLGLAIMINYALMGVMDIYLNMGTALMSNIAIGIGVDYTIHYLNGYLLLRKKGEDRAHATIHTTVRSGQAIVINAVSVAAGFLVMVFSSFVPLINSGWLISLTMVTTSISALTFIPVILNRFDRFTLLKKTPCFLLKIKGQTCA